MRESIEQEIFSLMRQRDQRFVGMLYDQYADGLYGVACQIITDESAARDVVQESFVKVWQRCGDFDPSKARLFTWLYSIVRNTAIDKLRVAQRRGAREIQTDVSDVSRMKYEAIVPEHTDLFDHLSSLEEKYREVIMALFYQGMTHKEASEALSIPLGTVKTRLKIGLRELRKIFANDQMIAILLMALMML